MNPPSQFRKLLDIKLYPATEEWLARKGISKDLVISAAWGVFLLTSVVMTLLMLLVLIFLGAQICFYLALPTLIIPLILSILLYCMPPSYARLEERLMARESPAVIGAMTMSMQFQPSIENGLLFAIQHNNGTLSMRLKEILWKPLCRSGTSLTSSFLDFSASLSEENESLRQSLHLIMSSTCERTKEGVDRLLDKANMVVLSGIRDSVDKYVASLSAPTMVLFALGVLLPVMLFSLVPLISVGTSFNISENGMEEGTGSRVPMSMLGQLLLVVFPISSFVHARSIIARSPLQTFRENDIIIDRSGIAFLFLWLSTIVIVLLVNLGDFFSYFMLFALVLPPSMFLCIFLRKNHTAQKKKVEMERDFVRAIFQIGSRMASGSSFEAALENTSHSKVGSEFSEVIDLVLYRARMSRSSLRELLMDELDSQGASSMLCGAVRTIVECSEKNPKGAGQSP